jgi:hypothetical protein
MSNDVGEVLGPCGDQHIDRLAHTIHVKMLDYYSLSLLYRWKTAFSSSAAMNPGKGIDHIELELNDEALKDKIDGMCRF